MMTENDALTDVFRLASAALVADLTEVKRQALADIADAIASLLPADRSARRSESVVFPQVPVGVPYIPTGADGSEPADADGVGEEPQDLAKFLTVAPDVQLMRFAGKDEIKLVARRKGRSGNPNTIFEINVSKQLKCAEVYKDGCRLFSILGANVNFSRVEKMAVSALRRWLKDRRPSRQARKRMRRRLGILTPEQELADTISRQKEDK